MSLRWIEERHLAIGCTLRVDFVGVLVIGRGVGSNYRYLLLSCRVGDKRAGSCPEVSSLAGRLIALQIRSSICLSGCQNIAKTGPKR